MGMPSIDGNISTTNSSEQQIIEDKNKQFLYARAMHASHMIQHHMQGISERQRVINEYRAMMDDGREMIPLDSELHQSDPVNDLQLGTDDDASTLATQETLAKNLVYVTNIPDGKLAYTKNARDSSKNSSKKDGKPNSPLEKPDQLIRKDTLNAYGTSKTNDKREKGEERTTNTWRTRKIIHMEFESDDDVAEPQKNAETATKEGKVRVTKKTVHYYEFSSDEEDKAHADPKKDEKTHADHEKSTKKSENDQALVSNEMTPSTIGSDIFIGDSAATSHMTNNKTGVYDLKPIRGSVMIGNGESISCTHKGKLDVICKHKDGSTAKHTWEVKIVSKLNHDLFSFTKAMKEGW